MAALGDVFTEFKNAKPPEKILIIGAGVAVVLVAIYLYKNRQTTTGTTTTSSSPASSGTSNSGQASIPLFPSGTTVGTDTSGQPTYGILPPTTTSTPTQSGGNPIIGSSPTQTNQPLYYGGNYSNLKWGTTYNYNGTTYQLGTGGGGRLWGVILNPGQQPLTQTQFNNVANKQAFSPTGVQPPTATANTATKQTLTQQNSLVMGTYANSGRRT